MVAISQACAAIPSTLPSDPHARDAAISALRCSIAASDKSIDKFGASSSPWEIVAIVAAFIVVIGVAGELVVIVSEYLEDLHGWRWLVWLPSRPPRSRFWFDIFATSLVVFGVLMEAEASLRLAALNSELRTETSLLRAHSDRLVEWVTQEAGEAAQSAHDAKEDANAISRELDSEIARERAAEHQIEVERHKRVRLAVSLRDREFHDQSGAIAALKQFPRMQVVFSWVDEREPRHTAERINFVFGQLGWPASGDAVSNPELMRDGVIVYPGVNMPFRSTGNVQADADAARLESETYERGIKAATELVKLLSDSGIDATSSPGCLVGLEEPPSTLVVCVGEKENHELDEALEELGSPQATPLVAGKLRISISGNLLGIPPRRKTPTSHPSQ